MSKRSPNRPDSKTALTRREVLKGGAALGTGAVIGGSVLKPVLASAQDAIEMSAEASAYYVPVEGAFAGETLRVVLNASFTATEASMQAFEGLREEFVTLTGAEVEFVPLPENQMYDQVLLELANNSGTFDMMHTGAGGAKDYGLSGFLVPLPAPPDIDDFYEGDVAQYSIAGDLYGLPMIGDINVLYWRTDLFEAAGLDPATPPATYEEFREYALQLTSDVNGNHPGDEGFDENNIDVFGSAFKGIAGLASTWEWYNYLYAFGGDLMDDQYVPSLDSPEAIASLAWVVENYQEHNIYPRDIPTYDYTEFQTLFIQGRMAMAINWPYMWALAQDPEQSTVAGMVAVGPKPSQVTSGGNIGGWSWNVFQMSENQELAIAFAKWMASPNASLAYATAGTGNPVRKSVAAMTAEANPELAAAIGANQESGRSVAWLATGQSCLEIEQVQYEAIQRALIGDASPEDALREANQAAKDILADNNFYEELAPALLGGA